MLLVDTCNVYTAAVTGVHSNRACAVWSGLQLVYPAVKLDTVGHIGLGVGVGVELGEPGKTRSLSQLLLHA